MKLRCSDGVVRLFDIGGYFDYRVSSEGSCTHCGALFGVHDLRILKPLFREHTCSYKGAKNYSSQHAKHGAGLNYREAPTDTKGATQHDCR